MHLLVGIPAYNEAATIAHVIERVPKEVVGVDTVESSSLMMARRMTRGLWRRQRARRLSGRSRIQVSVLRSSLSSDTRSRSVPICS